jgi:hypothetical protein
MAFLLTVSLFIFVGEKVRLASITRSDSGFFCDPLLPDVTGRRYAVG